MAHLTRERRAGEAARGDDTEMRAPQAADEVLDGLVARVREEKNLRGADAPGGGGGGRGAMRGAGGAGREE